MLTVLALMSKVVFSPLWLLWQLYCGLWWAFQDDPRPAVRPPRLGEPAQARAFEVVDTSPPVPPPPARPLGALRGGFFGSIGLSISLAYLANVMVMNHWLDPARAASAWLLTSAATLVASLYAVRASVRREQAARAARAARGGPVQRILSKTPGAGQVTRLAGHARVAASSVGGAAHASFSAARLGAPKAVSACSAGLRCGVGRLAAGLSRLEARLGAPKTAGAAPRSGEPA